MGVVGAVGHAGHRRTLLMSHWVTSLRHLPGQEFMLGDNIYFGSAVNLI